MDIDAIHKALANPVRRQLLAWLKEPEVYFADQPHPLTMGVCAGMLDRKAALSQSTISAHLATLLKAELISSQRVGQWNYFKRNEAVIAAFVAHMNSDL